MSTVRVYRLEIDYPEGSGAPGWRPAVWTDPAYLATCDRRLRREIRRRLRGPFKWPRERMYLSASGAHNRAWKLRFYGAVVTVRASAPVEWPDIPEKWELTGDAASWYRELEDGAPYDFEEADVPFAGSDDRETADVQDC
jgi:hypothetical protein